MLPKKYSYKPGSKKYTPRIKSLFLILGQSLYYNDIYNYSYKGLKVYAKKTNRGYNFGVYIYN